MSRGIIATRRSALRAPAVCLLAILLAPSAMRSALAREARSEPFTPQANRRNTEQTYLTFPEWFLVFSPAEYAEVVKTQSPDMFPFLGHIRQFWSSYATVGRAASTGYPFNFGYHAMIVVIGTSTTVEYLIRSAYETLIGRVARATHSGFVDEDVFAARYAQDYVDFIRVHPWYEYDFDAELKRLWTEVPMNGPGFLRKWERKYILSTEFIVKALYGRLIGGGTHAAYDPEIESTVIAIDRAPAITSDAPLKDLRITSAEPDQPVMASAPRYQAFTQTALALAAAGVSFDEIAGNRDVILVTVLRNVAAPRLDGTRLLFSQPIITTPSLKRDALVIPVTSLSFVLRRLVGEGAEIEHIYDY